MSKLLEIWKGKSIYRGKSITFDKTKMRINQLFI